MSKTCWTVKEALTLHAVTGAFIFLRNALQAKVPHADFTACIGDINDQFMKGFLDAELEQLLSTSVPSTSLGEVSFMRILASVCLGLASSSTPCAYAFFVGANEPAPVSLFFLQSEGLQNNIGSLKGFKPSLWVKGQLAFSPLESGPW